MKRSIPALLLSLTAIFLGFTVAYPILNLFICGFLAILVLASWAFSRIGLRSEDRSRNHDAIHVVCLLVVVAATATHFLFKVRFLAAKNQLTSLVDAHLSGDSIPLPINAGTFRILDVGKKADGSVYLWTNDNPSGPQGFVFRYQFQFYNPFSELKLNDQWHFVAED